jgi:glutathione S-transferase
MLPPNKVKLYIQEVGPFPQVAMITLLEKGAKRDIDFEVEAIDLNNKPDSFLKLSPTGKLPLLEVDGIPIFETSVIIECIDDIVEPYGQYRFDDPILRAKNRSWILFGLNLLMDVFRVVMAKDEQTYRSELKVAIDHFAKLEAVLGDGPYFNGKHVSLIDFVYATLFLRQELFDKYYGLSILGDFSKVSQWSKQLRARSSTLDSLPDHFEQSSMSWISSSGSYLVQS